MAAKKKDAPVEPVEAAPEFVVPENTKLADKAARRESRPRTQVRAWCLIAGGAFATTWTRFEEAETAKAGLNALLLLRAEGVPAHLIDPLIREKEAQN